MVWILKIQKLILLRLLLIIVQTVKGGKKAIFQLRNRPLGDFAAVELPHFTTYSAIYIFSLLLPAYYKSLRVGNTWIEFQSFQWKRNFGLHTG
jgi:hypothetical protein